MSSGLFAARLPMKRRAAIGWLAVLVAASLALAWLYPRAFPQAPRDWSVTRAEAIRIAESRITMLGSLPEDPYFSVGPSHDQPLEIRLLRARQRGVALDGGKVEPRLHSWLVHVYPDDAAVGSWDYRVQVGFDGTVLSIMRGTPPDFRSSATLDFENAVQRANAFLVEQGFDLALFDAPIERRIDLPNFSYLLVRYRDHGRDMGPGVEYGVEVRFMADQLAGFSSWQQAPDTSQMAELFRPTSLQRTFHVFAVFLVLPVIGVIFLRRYHEGVIGARRAVQVGAVIMASAAVLLLMTARSAAEGSSFGNTTRWQVTVAFTLAALIVYYPATAAAAAMSAAIGEAGARGTWRGRLASFDALFALQWQNGTVAASALRGGAVGLAVVAALLAGAALAARWEIFLPSTVLLQSFWVAAPMPGLSLVLVAVIVTLVAGCFGLLWAVPSLVDRLGPWVGGLLSVLLLGLLFAPLHNVVPELAGIPLWLACAALWVFLFVRFDLLTALLAMLAARVGLGALPLLHASDVALEVQGWGAVLVSLLPLWISLRWAGSSYLYRYDYDDVPPHVRRIAERERQRVELETARKIQGSILPKLPPMVRGLELAYHYEPATEVGGDFYDVVPLDDGRIAVAVGDVAGHGVSSGLIMSMVRSALAVQARHDPGVEAVFRTLNQTVHQSAQSRLLATMCYLVIAPESGALEYASAGHVYPYRLRPGGGVEMLESTAYPLGVRRYLDVEVRTAVLAPGESLFFTSDGLVEARRQGGEEQFGFERLEEVLAESGGRSAVEARELVMTRLSAFVAPVGPDRSSLLLDDDLTILVMRRPPAGGVGR